MRNPFTTAGLVLLAAWLVPAAPASAQAQTVDSAARAECREEQRFDRAEFRQDYGGTGDRAFRRCVREQKREARRDCREERREDRAEYRREYGSGAAAFRRCVIDEIR
jgi:hypothetical protein